MSALWQRRSGFLSTQVLEEYYVTVTGKLQPGLPEEEARSDIRALAAWRPLPLETELVESAWLIQDRFGLGFWDALIVAAARQQHCDILVTEDLQDGQNLDGVRVVNPFLRAPGELFPDSSER